jgi:hypothetical protein
MTESNPPSPASAGDITVIPDPQNEPISQGEKGKVGKVQHSFQEFPELVLFCFVLFCFVLFFCFDKMSLRYDGTLEARTPHGTFRILLCVTHQFAARFFLQQVVSLKYSASQLSKVISGFYLEIHPGALQSLTADLTTEMHLEEGEDNEEEEEEEEDVDQTQTLGNEITSQSSEDLPANSFSSFFPHFFDSMSLTVFFDGRSLETVHLSWDGGFEVEQKWRNLWGIHHYLGTK